MPNTFAHFGVQGLTTRVLLKDTDPKLIYLGCLIPDIPWMVKRFILLFTFPAVNHHDLTLYVVVQASLFFCILLSFSIALFFSHFWKTFSVLGFNSLFHLVLDACETKWGNGVHFFAPLNWQMTNFGFFWPDSLLAYLFTILGVAFFTWTLRQSFTSPFGITLRPTVRVFSAMLPLIIYILLPIPLIRGPEDANNNYMKTLQLRQDRPGQYIEFDRASYTYLPSGGVLRSDLTLLNVAGNSPRQSATVSVQGTFVSEDSIYIHEYHVHTKWFRNSASYLAVALFGLLIVGYHLNRNTGRTEPEEKLEKR